MKEEDISCGVLQEISLTMEFSNKKLTAIVIVCLIVFNFMYFFDFNFLYIRTIFSATFWMLIPGILIMQILKIRMFNLLRFITYVLGFSLAFLIIAGLLTNLLLLLFGIAQPLSSYPLLISFDVIIILLVIITLSFNRNNSLPRLSFSPGWLDGLFFCIPPVILILSIGGVFILNNGGNNYISLFTLGAMSVYFFVVFLLRNKLNKNIYPYSGFFFTATLILMFSLRSWYISGPDISYEYRMFLLTESNGFWSNASSSHAYNGCLSVTILPIILSKFLGIDGVIIFKFIYPFIFAITSIGIYLLLSKHFSKMHSFLGLLFFISYISSTIDMSVHARQAIAILFFTLSLLSLFTPDLSKVQMKSAFYIFTFGMIVSHYSTNFLAVAFYVGTYLLSTFIRWICNINLFRKKCKSLNIKLVMVRNREQFRLRGSMVLILIVATILWWSPITSVKDNVIYLVTNSALNMKRIFTADIRAENASVIDQFFYRPTNPAILLEQYTETLKAQYENPDAYTSAQSAGYTSRVMSTETTPLKINANISVVAFQLARYLRLIMKLFIIIGTISFFVLIKRNKSAEYEWATLSIMALFLLLAIMVLPLASLEYDLERTYLQALIILVFSWVWGGLHVTRFLRIRDSHSSFFLLFLLIVYFMFNSGLLTQLIGGTSSPTTLANFGVHYDRFYVHKSEVESAKWLTVNRGESFYIYADPDAKNKLVAHSNIPFISINEYVLPSVLGKSGYVYTSWTNTIKGRAYAYYRGQSINYNYPLEFLNQNKNLIYNNIVSEIFK